MTEFRYFAEPHGSSSTWTTEPRRCDLCGAIGAGYEGPYVGRERIDFVCEPCLVGGRLAERDVRTNEGDANVVDPSLRAELEQRTPRLVSWQDWFWPSHCDDFCRFECEAGQRELSAAAADGDGARFLAAHLDDEPLQWEEVPASLAGEDGYELGVYLFRCLGCGAARIRWDLA